MKDLELKAFVNKLKSIGQMTKRYAVVIFIVILVGIYGFLVYRINVLTQTEPSETAVNEQLQTVQRPKVDQNAIDKIQKLQNQNVEVKSLFDQARNNPFSE